MNSNDSDKNLCWNRLQPEEENHSDKGETLLLMKCSIGMMDLTWGVQGFKWMEKVGIQNSTKTSFTASSFIRERDRHLQIETAKICQ